MDLILTRLSDSFNAKRYFDLFTAGNHRRFVCTPTSYAIIIPDEKNLH